MAKDKKSKTTFKVLTKKGLMGLAMIGIIIASPFMLTGCSNGQDGKDGTPGVSGTIWKSGTSYTAFTDAKVGDYFIDTDDYILYQKTADSWAIVMENYGRPATSGGAPIIEINAEGYWVIDGVPQTVKAKGEKGEPGNTPEVEIIDGFWYINGVKAIKAEGVDGKPGTIPEIAINEDGYWVVGGTTTETKATPSKIEIIDGKWYIDDVESGDAKGKGGNTWTVGTSYPATANNGDMFLNNSTWNVYQYNGTTWGLKGNIKGASTDEPVTENIVDLVIFMGQSNMAGRGDYRQATKVPQGHGYEFRAVSDPTKLYGIGERAFGVNENKGVISETSKTGSMVPAIMNSYYEYTGVPIVGVSASKGGQSIDFWKTDGDAMTETIARYTSAKNYLTANGYTIRHQYMVWCQGETDGRLEMSVNTYKTKLQGVFNEMKEQGVEKSLVIRIGNNRDNATLYDNIILAQTELCAESDDFVMITGKLAGMADAGLMKDEAHYTQEAYNIVGADAGKNMAYFVNTGMEPYYYDSEYDNYYPFGNYLGTETNNPTTNPTTVSSYVVDVSKNTHDLSSLGTVSNGKVTIATGSRTNYLELTEFPVLSDDYDWTCEVVTSNLQVACGMIANTGTNGSGFIGVPSRTPATATSQNMQFRFRDEGKTLQIDMTVPDDYDPTEKHHFALSYNATTKTFKAYIDYVEVTVNYTVGSQGGTFNDTALKNILGGYPSDTSNFAGDFYYFAFTKNVLVPNEMYHA